MKTIPSEHPLQVNSAPCQHLRQQVKDLFPEFEDPSRETATPCAAPECSAGFDAKAPKYLPDRYVADPNSTIARAQRADGTWRWVRGNRPFLVARADAERIQAELFRIVEAGATETTLVLPVDVGDLLASRVTWGGEKYEVSFVVDRQEQADWSVKHMLSALAKMPPAAAL